LSYAAAVDEQVVVNAVHSAPYVPAHDVAADVAQLRVLFEEMQLPVPTYDVHASNLDMSSYSSIRPNTCQMHTSTWIALVWETVDCNMC